MKALWRVIRNGVPFTPTGDYLKYYKACVNEEEEDGVYTAHEEIEPNGEISVWVSKEEGSPWAL